MTGIRNIAGKSKSAVVEILRSGQAGDPDIQKVMLIRLGLENPKIR